MIFKIIRKNETMVTGWGRD